MTFSSPGTLNRDRATQLVKEIRKVVTASGLVLHAQKTKIVPPGSRKIVLGMLISDDGVSILPEHRRMIDLYIHAVNKYGPVDYAVRRRFDSVLSFINHVEGWLAYLSHIDRTWTKARSEAWNEALVKHGVVTSSLG